VILEVGGKAVASADDVRDAITAARTDNKNSVLMRVKSGGSSRFVQCRCARAKYRRPRWRVSTALVAPAAALFRGAGQSSLPLATFRWNTPPSVGRA